MTDIQKRIDEIEINFIELQGVTCAIFKHEGMVVGSIYGRAADYIKHLQAQLVERDRVIAIADKALQSWDGYYANSELVYEARNKIYAINKAGE